MRNTRTSLGLDIRSQFPIYVDRTNPLAFLDSAASSQKPYVVIERMAEYLSHEHANIHRGAYALSAKASEAYEGVRAKVAALIGALDHRSIVFTKNATESINLVAHSFGQHLKKGDTILLSLLEHHSNIVPWQLLAQSRGVKIVFAGILPEASLDIDDFSQKVKEHKPKLIAITAQSNAFGSVTPLEKIISCARQYDAKVLVDASQRIVHDTVDVHKLDIDFLVFTGHKLYGPTGVGVLYGKPELLESMGPFLGGGDMIEQVTVDGSTWAEIPRRFEAGTPPIAEVIGLGTAIDFVNSVGFEAIKAHEKKVFDFGLDLLSREPGVTVYGPHKRDIQRSIISFNVANVHSHDLATIVDSVGAQVRSGHHCAMPALKALSIQSTARASLAMYTDTVDFEVLLEGIKKAKKLFFK